MIYFSKEMTKEEAKKIFRKWCIELHPDKASGNAVEFIKMQSQYESLLRGTFAYTTKDAKEESNALKDFINANEFVKGMDGVTVELTGTWVWLSGNTFSFKDIIKENGFKWSKSKKKWYKAPEGTVQKKKRGTNFKTIQKKYGYQSATMVGNVAIA